MMYYIYIADMAHEVDADAEAEAEAEEEPILKSDPAVLSLSHVYKSQIVKLTEEIPKHPNLISLRLDSCYIDTKKLWFKQFTEVLSTSNINRLRISGYIDGPNLSHLYRILPKYPKLKSLEHNIEPFILSPGVSGIMEQKQIQESFETLLTELPKSNIIYLELNSRSFTDEALIIIAQVVAKMHLKSLNFSELDDIDCEHKLLAELEGNITIEEIPMLNSSLRKLADRNKAIQCTIRKSVLTLIAIRRFKKGFLLFPLEIVVMIAKYLHSTRGDVIWLKKN